jgi:hypothetical protein
MPLTDMQRKLFDEARNIAKLTLLDYASVEESQEDEEARTMTLRFAINRMVLAEVVRAYTFMDETLAEIIARYFFRVPKIRYWRDWDDKKFLVFTQNILDELYLLKKMEIVHAIEPLPSKPHNIRSTIYRLNDIRNAFAHSSEPQYRKEHRKNYRVLYDGKDIETFEGIRHFVQDTVNALNYLHTRIK